nr:diguanylate cyclase [Marinobacter salexigens]
MSQRIKQQLRDADTFARTGGDEFVVLLPQIKDNLGVKQIMPALKRLRLSHFRFSIIRCNAM